jgi:hypothetical protein
VVLRKQHVRIGVKQLRHVKVQPLSLLYLDFGGTLRELGRLLRCQLHDVTTRVDLCNGRTDGCILVAATAIGNLGWELEDAEGVLVRV